MISRKQLIIKKQMQSQTMHIPWVILGVVRQVSTICCVIRIAAKCLSHGLFLSSTININIYYNIYLYTTESIKSVAQTTFKKKHVHPKHQNQP